MNIYDIKDLTASTEPHFFTKDALKFFGQKMNDFTLKLQKDGRTLISAPMYDADGNNVGDTIRYFNPTNNKLERN